MVQTKDPHCEHCLGKVGSRIYLLVKLDKSRKEFIPLVSKEFLTFDHGKPWSAYACRLKHAFSARSSHHDAEYVVVLQTNSDPVVISACWKINGQEQLQEWWKNIKLGLPDVEGGRV